MSPTLDTITRSQTRTLAILTSTLALTSCGNQTRPDKSATPQAIIQTAPTLTRAPSAREAALPSGLYFRPGRYESRACPDCPQPEWVVLAGVFERGEDATQRAKSLTDLPLGYPWGVHTLELALKDPEPEGLALVAGLFVTREAAESLAARDPSRLTVTQLASAEEAEARSRARHSEHDGWKKEHEVIQLMPHESGAIAAYSREVLDQVSREMNAKSWDSFQDYFDTHLTAVSEEHEPICEVEAGSLHLIEDHDDIFRYNRFFLPVQCPDGSRAFVHLTETRYETVISKRTDGSGRLIQVLVVECDTATFEEWRYDGKRRAPASKEERLAIASAGCGAGS